MTALSEAKVDEYRGNATMSTSIFTPDEPMVRRSERVPSSFLETIVGRRGGLRDICPVSGESTIYLYPSRESLRPRYGNTTTERPIFPSCGHGETDEDIVTRNSRPEKLSIDLVLEQWLPPRKKLRLAK
jgi:rRNA maturation protein Nop10